MIRTSCTKRTLAKKKSLLMLMLWMMCGGATVQAMASDIGESTWRRSAPSEEVPPGRPGQLPSLPHLLSLALKNDSQLARQRYRMQASRQEIPKATAGLKPQVSANIGYSYQQADNIYTDNPERYPDEVYDDRVSGVTDDAYWQVELSQPLFNLERWKGIDRAREEVDAALLEVAVTERDLALEVVSAYLDAYLASSKIGLLQAKEESLALQRRQSQRAYELGLGDRINVMEAQARLDQTVADQIEAENELDNALSDLQRLTDHLADFSRMALGDLAMVELDRPHYGQHPAWLERADDNVQVRLARQQYEVARLDTEVRRASRYPQLNLNLSYGDRRSSDELRSSQDLTASVELSADLYRGGFTTANIRQGELTHLATREAIYNESRLAKVEIQRRLRNLEGGRRRLDALSRSIESSALFLQAAILGEDLGLRDLVDVIDARAELYDLRIRVVEVICQHIADRLNLEAAVGDLDTADLFDAMSLLQRITTSKADGNRPTESSPSISDVKDVHSSH